MKGGPCYESPKKENAKEAVEFKREYQQDIKEHLREENYQE